MMGEAASGYLQLVGEGTLDTFVEHKRRSEDLHIQSPWPISTLHIRCLTYAVETLCTSREVDIVDDRGNALEGTWLVTRRWGSR